jgi:hypothetical protein
MLELRAGDCDDMSILLAAMLEAVGHPVRLALAGPDPLQPRLFTHVYLEVYYKGRWIPLDPTMPYPPGWSPRTLVKKIIPIERSATMVSQDMELQGVDGLAAAPDWLRGLIRAWRAEGLQPKDERVRRLWNMLRQRQILRQNDWLRRVLRFAWNRGLARRPRPRTTRRLVQLLRGAGILPVRTGLPVRPGAIRPLRRVRVRRVQAAPVRTLQPATRTVPAAGRR